MSMWVLYTVDPTTWAGIGLCFLIVKAGLFVTSAGPTGDLRCSFLNPEILLPMILPAVMLIIFPGMSERFHLSPREPAFVSVGMELLVAKEHLGPRFIR